MLPSSCNPQELRNSLSVLNQTFEDIEPHVARDSYVGFLGAVLEPPAFGREGPLQLLILPGLPGSLQIVVTMMGFGLVDPAATADVLGSRGDGVPRIPLQKHSLDEFTGPHFVTLARKRLGIGARGDLNSVSQKELEDALLWQSADVMIAAIGAGLTNLLFMRPGTTVVALHPNHPTVSFSTYSSKCGQSYFWHIASQLGIGYWTFMCPGMTVFDGGVVDEEDFRSFLQTSILPSFSGYLHDAELDV